MFYSRKSFKKYLHNSCFWARIHKARVDLTFQTNSHLKQIKTSFNRLLLPFLFMNPLHFTICHIMPEFDIEGFVLRRIHSLFTKHLLEQKHGLCNYLLCYQYIVSGDLLSLSDFSGSVLLNESFQKHSTWIVSFLIYSKIFRSLINFLPSGNFYLLETQLYVEVHFKDFSGQQ